MNTVEISAVKGEFYPLTDSLASRVRWRISDYEAIVRAEIDMLLETGDVEEPALMGAPRERID